MILRIFSCIYWLFPYLFWRDCYSSPLPIFYLSYLSFCCWIVRVLYIFYILDPYQIHDLQIFFSHSVGCFTFLIVIFYKQKFVILLKSSLSAFSLIVLLRACQRNHCLFQGLICSWALISKGNWVMTRRGHCY